MSDHSLNSTVSVPDRPNAVMVTSTATTISLSWKVHHDSLGSYELVWERYTSGKCADEDMGNSTITAGSTDYTIMGLEEDSKYIITVTATNAAGSAVGDPITVVTKEAGEGCNINRNEVKLSAFLQPHLPLPLMSVYLT